MDDDTRVKMYDVFAKFFLLSQRLQYIVDQELKKDQLTTKQFLMIVVIERAFDHAPAINEVAEVLSTTHQNVKQMANQLEKKGFIAIERDEKDRRVLRLKTTAKNREYWDSTAEEHERFILSLFHTFREKQIHRLHRLVDKLLTGTDELYRIARQK